VLTSLIPLGVGMGAIFKVLVVWFDMGAQFFTYGISFFTSGPSFLHKVILVLH